MSTFLIVDDHASFRAQAKALLEENGHVVVGEALDGRSGLEMARALLPEAVLLDVGLPDMDGIEVARRLAKAPGSPAVILTSSREAAEYGPRLTGCPAAGFIAKDELSGPTVAALLAGVSTGPGTAG